MANFNLKVNGQNRQVEVDPATPLLWVLREHLNLVGTKYGCGIAVCGSCTVHLGGVVVGREVTEGRFTMEEAAGLLAG